MWLYAKASLHDFMLTSALDKYTKFLHKLVKFYRCYSDVKMFIW